MKNHFFAVRSLARPMPMLILTAVTLLALIVALPPFAAAADLVWVGNDGANNSNFSESGNWQGNVLPTWSSSNSLVFTQNQNSNVTGLVYNLSGWQPVDDIKWDSTFPVARTLSSSNGNGIDFRVRLENLSSFTQTVTMNLSGGKNGASDIQLNPVKGSLILSGTIFNDNSVDYTVYGNDTGSLFTTNLTLNTALGPNAPTQANVDFTVAPGRYTTVQVNASQVWAGTTDVQSGSFTTANGVTLASTAIVVGGGIFPTFTTTSANTLADGASLTVNGGRLAIGGSDTVASLAGSGGTIEIASGATLTAGNASSTSYAGSITGGGGFTKVGSGTFTLSATSSYTGTTTVTAGQLSLGGSNLLADTSAVAVAGGVLALGGNSDTVGTFAISGGSLTGSGTVTAANYTLGGGTVSANLGSGAVNVTGNASLNGTSNGTTLNLTSGTLTLGSAGRLAATTAVAVTGSAGGALALGGNETIGSLAGVANVALGSNTLTVGGNNQSTTYSGGLNGAGSLTKVGNGTLTLSGTNFVNGTAAIDGGALAIGSIGALQSTSTISFGGGTLEYATASFVDYSSRFSKAAGQQYRVDTNGYNVAFMSPLTSVGGSLTKLGAGNLQLSGTNSYSGGTTVSGGSLVGTTASIQGNIVNNANVYFFTDSSGTYAGIMSGTGSLTAFGTAGIALTAANTYTGLTEISRGGLQLNGSIAGSLSVASLASLSGTGTVGGNATIAGTHSPGNSPGAQTFNGNLTYDAGAVVNWELIGNTSGAPGTNYDQILLPTGNLAFSGSTTLALSFDSVGSSVDWTNAFWNVNRSWIVYDLSGGTTIGGLSNLSLGGSLLDSLNQPLSPTGRGYFTTSLVGQDVVLNFTAVPEPSTWAMALAGLACGGYVMRRRRKRD
jgi:fibronectin-binding autotransporter adhesin